jgi:hypothetical protein
MTLEFKALLGPQALWGQINALTADAIWTKHLGPDNEFVRLVRGTLARLDAE